MFEGAEGVECRVKTLVDSGEGEGHAPSIFLREGIGGDEAVFEGEGGGVGKEGSGVAIFADSEHDEVK